MKSLLEIMNRLRDPEAGCPWDLAQDFSSISPHTIEEAYEVDDAIARGDLEALRDELGDLLFQVVFQARLADERGAFDFEGVTEAIVAKLIRRHPHVFADEETPTSVDAQAAKWEAIKDAERQAANPSSDAPPDPFAGIPRSLPALARSSKVAGRLARIELEQGAAEERSNESGGQADTLAALARTRDAVSEVMERLSSTQNSHARDADVAAAERASSLRLVGGGLRAWVLLARELGVDPEQALRALDDELIESTRTSRPASNQHQGSKALDR